MTKPSLSKSKLLFLLLFALLLAARLCHVGILWAEETLPLAAAQQIRAGKVLYRDIWFDKPPLAPALYAVLGGEPGWLLRVAGALYSLLCCWIAWGFARELWGGVEGMWAAGLLGFFLIFDFPASVIPLAADFLMLAPHLAAVWLAYRRRPMWSGALAGVAFAINPKGVLVLAVCACWAPSWRLVAGFAGVTGAVSAWMWGAGSLAAYWDEVWRWGRIYAGTTFVEAPVKNGLLRTLNWAGFHAAIVIAAAAGISRRGFARTAAWIVWLVISLAGVTAGFRFFPRYYLQLLPVVVLLAARGFAEMRGRQRAVALLLLIPLARLVLHTIWRRAMGAGGIRRWTGTAVKRRRWCARRRSPGTRSSCGDTGRKSMRTRTCRRRRDFWIRSR